MKIVVPLDLSEVAARAIEPAKALARALGDELVFVTVAGLRIRADLLAQAASEQVEVPDLIESYLRSVASDVDGIPADYFADQWRRCGRSPCRLRRSRGGEDGRDGHSRQVRLREMEAGEHHRAGGQAQPGTGNSDTKTD